MLSVTLLLIFVVILLHPYCCNAVAPVFLTYLSASDSSLHFVFLYAARDINLPLITALTFSHSMVASTSLFSSIQSLTSFLTSFCAFWLFKSSTHLFSSAFLCLLFKWIMRKITPWSDRSMTLHSLFYAYRLLIKKKKKKCALDYTAWGAE